MSLDSNPLLIHLHIPKNAGTTLGRSLRLRTVLYPPSRLLHPRTALGFHNIRHYEPRLEKIAALSVRQRQRIGIFEAHAGYGLHERLPSPSTYITMLREPIDRVLSIYFSHRARGRFPATMSLGEFVQQHEPRQRWWIDNAQVRYLACEGGKVLDCPVGEVNRAHLDLAKERLERDFLWCGIVEQFDQSMNLLRRRLGWKHLYYTTSNVTKKRRSRDEMPPADLKRIKELNELDFKLYDYAKAQLEQSIAQEGPGFLEELERFRAANRVYANTAGRFYWVFSLMRMFRRRFRRLRQANGASTP